MLLASELVTMLLVGFVLGRIWQIRQGLRSCPGEWCNSGEAVVMSGEAGLIKLSRRLAA